MSLQESRTFTKTLKNRYKELFRAMDSGDDYSKMLSGIEAKSEQGLTISNAARDRLVRLVEGIDAKKVNSINFKTKTIPNKGIEVTANVKMGDIRSELQFLSKADDISANNLTKELRAFIKSQEKLVINDIQYQVKMNTFAKALLKEKSNGMTNELLRNIHLTAF